MMFYTKQCIFLFLCVKYQIRAKLIIIISSSSSNIVVLLVVLVMVVALELEKNPNAFKCFIMGE